MKATKEITRLRIHGARLPRRLAPYFQEYDVKQLSLARDANLVIQRTLEFGTVQEIQWLFRVYGKARVKRFLTELGERGLSRKAFNYWRMLLGVRKWRQSPFRIAREQVWPYS